MIGSIVMIFILLFLTVGLVVSVRFSLRLARDSVVASRAEAGRRETLTAAAAQEQPHDDDERPVSGRELKERYLRGEMSKAEYDRRLRSLQLDDYLKGRQ